MEINVGMMGALVALVLAGIAGVVYVIRLEGRIASDNARTEEKFKSLTKSFEDAVKSAVDKIETQRKSDIELVNEKLGNLRNGMARHEQAIWSRVRSVERITGKAHVFNSEDEENGG